MKLEKFNLEKALNGAKVVTRDGCEVTQLTKFESNERNIIYGVIESNIFNWDIDGCVSYFDSKIKHLDIFIAVEPKSIWVNLYSTIDGGIILGHCYKIKEDAEYDGKSNSSYIKTIEITE